MFALSLLFPRAAIADDQIEPLFDLRYSQMRLSLEDSRFSGYGFDSSKQRIEVDASGRQIGLSAPSFEWLDFGTGLTGDLGPGRFYGLFLIGYGWGTGQSAPADREAASRFKPSGLWGMRIGMEFSYGYPTAFVAPYAGLGTGVRLLNVPLTLDSHCPAKSFVENLLDDSSEDCGGSSRMTEVYLMPRVGMLLFPKRLRVGFTLFAAADLLHPGTAEFGVGISYRVEMLPYRNRR